MSISTIPGFVTTLANTNDKIVVNGSRDPIAYAVVSGSLEVEYTYSPGENIDGDTAVWINANTNMAPGAHNVVNPPYTGIRFTAKANNTVVHWTR